MDQDLAGKIGMEKIRNARSVGAQGIVTACVFCDIQLTQVQFGESIQPEERVPVITLPQFMGPALGISDQVLGLYLTKISPDHILEALQEAKT
jgi:heterodisulfide reductase subunit B